jgi:chromosome segregation ATPase
MVDLRLTQLLEQNKVQGVYGYLIEHVKIEKDVAFAYELAGLSKLCTLLVENDQVAAKVI